LALENILQKNEVDPIVLLGGNTVIFIATLLSFLIYYRSLKKAASTGVLKGLYMSFIAKFFICLLAAFAYIMIHKKNINQPALFISMGLYIFYTIIEVATLQRILGSSKKNQS
jgi:hypothetical protein